MCWYNMKLVKYASKQRKPDGSDASPRADRRLTANRQLFKPKRHKTSPIKYAEQTTPNNTTKTLLDGGGMNNRHAVYSGISNGPLALAVSIR